MRKQANRILRREFLKLTAGAGVAALVRPGVLRGSAPDFPNPVGYAAISWPEEQFEHALESMSALGFAGVQMLGWVLEDYGDRVEVLRDRLETLRLKPVALSCWGVSLRPDDPETDVELFRSYAEFFSRLGGLYLQVTDGGKPDVDYPDESIRQLGERTNELGRIAADHGLALGYHPHMGTLGETREGMARVLEATDERYVKLIPDVGHIALGGTAPTEIVRAYGSRLLFFHFKDVRKDAAELAREGRDLVRGREYVFCEIGTGVVDFPGVLEACREVQFNGWIIVELDGSEPRQGGPDESAAINKQALQKLGLKV